MVIGSGFDPAAGQKKTAGQIEKAQRHQYSMFDVRICSLLRTGGFSYERRRWPRAASLIGIETF